MFYFFSEIETLTELTQILKLKSFPVTVSDQKLNPELPQEVAVDKFQRTPKLCRRRAPRTSAAENGAETSSSPTSTTATILSTQTTRSGRVVVHKRFVDEIVGDVDVTSIEHADIVADVANNSSTTKGALNLDH